MRIFSAASHFQWQTANGVAIRAAVTVRRESSSYVAVQNIARGRARLSLCRIYVIVPAGSTQTFSQPARSLTDRSGPAFAAHAGRKCQPGQRGTKAGDPARWAKSTDFAKRLGQAEWICRLSDTGAAERPAGGDHGASDWPQRATAAPAKCQLRLAGHLPAPVGR
jgi:hypothetical protein